MKYHQPFDQPTSPDAPYVDADPSLGVRGSIPPAAAFEQAQREIVKVITEAGLTPSDADLTQLWQAIQSIAGTIANTTITEYLDTNNVDVNVPFAVAGGTADAITAQFSPQIATLGARRLALLKVGANGNTGPDVTLQVVDGNGDDVDTAKPVIRTDGSTLAQDDMAAGSLCILLWDAASTSWMLIGSAYGSGAGGSGGGSYIPGHVYMWPLEIAPTGTLECAGQAVSRTTYARLFNILGTTYGAGDGSTTFNLPDLRAMVPRGWDHGRGLDPDRATRGNRGDGTTGDHVGTTQAGAAGPISLSAVVTFSSIAAVSATLTSPQATADGTDGTKQLGMSSPTGGGTGPYYYLSRLTGDNPVKINSLSGSLSLGSLIGNLSISGNSGAGETRMRNINMMYVIAY